MSIYIHLVALLFDGGGKGSFAYSLLHFFFVLLSTENSILVWESNNSTLVLKNSLSRFNSIGFRQGSNSKFWIYS